MKCLIEWEPSGTSSITDKPSLFAWFVDFAWREGLIDDRRNVAALLSSREYAGDTLLSGNLANPHVQSTAVADTALVLLKLKRACPGWQSSSRVDRVLFTLVPESPAADDIAPLKRFYHRLADERIMHELCCGERKIAESILVADRKSPGDHGRPKGKD